MNESINQSTKQCYKLCPIIIVKFACNFNRLKCTNYNEIEVVEIFVDTFKSISSFLWQSANFHLKNTNTFSLSLQINLSLVCLWPKCFLRGPLIYTHVWMSKLILASHQFHTTYVITFLTILFFHKTEMYPRTNKGNSQIYFSDIKIS